MFRRKVLETGSQQKWKAKKFHCVTVWTPQSRHRYTPLVHKTKVKGVRFYSMRNFGNDDDDDNVPISQVFKKSTVTLLSGSQKMSPKVAKIFGIDVEIVVEESCPIIVSPGLPCMQEIVGSLGLHRPGSDFRGFVPAGLFKPHFYCYGANIGSIQDCVSKSGRSELEIRDALAEVPIAMALWSGGMMNGGARLQWDQLPTFLKGGTVDAILTNIAKDPVRISNLTRQFENSSSMVSFLARTLYGHALTGSVLHQLLVMPNGQIIFFWVGAGGGRSYFSAPGFINYPAAYMEGTGMWPTLSRNLRRALLGKNVIDLICEVSRSVPPEDVVKAVASSRSPEDLLAKLILAAGHIVRVPSELYGSLSRQSGSIKK